MTPGVGRFLLGSHQPGWLGRAQVPLFVSDRRLRVYKRLPRAVTGWALDSGGFTELQYYGRWTVPPTEYAARVRRYRDQVGRLAWAAPQDWMCEPVVIAGGRAGSLTFAGTGLYVGEHQERTVGNLSQLREMAPDLPFIPVVQGYTAEDYLACVDLYATAGIDLTTEPLVGLGSVCRRQATGEAHQIITALHARGVRRLHGFGIKTLGLIRYGHLLTSADSMAWSYDARRRPALPGCVRHKNCANCLALRPALAHPTPHHPDPVQQAGRRMTHPARTPVTADGILTALNAPAALRAVHGDEAPPSTGSASVVWDAAPVPLTARRMLPPFPVDVLPTWVADEVTARADFTQTPVDLGGCIALACLSTAAGRRAMIEVRPGWQEPVNIYTVVALPPGSRKTPVFNALSSPLLAAEKALQEISAPFRARARAEAEQATAQAEKLTHAAKNAAGSEDAGTTVNDAAEAILAAEQHSVPAIPQLLADDTTPETAASLLAEQGGRLAILSDEGGIFSILAGCYSGAPNIDLFLAAHPGKQLRVNRRGRPPEIVDNPALTVGVAVHPSVLTDLAGVKTFLDRGFLARILYSHPANTVGYRTPGRPAPADTVTTAYMTQMRALVLGLSDLDEPAVIPLTLDADARVLELEREIEPRLRPDEGDLGGVGIADWGGKLNGAIVRLAGLLHLATHHRAGITIPISLDTIEDAARLGHYYLAHALSVFEFMGADPVTGDARAILGWIHRHRLTECTRRDIFAGLRSKRFKKVTDLDAALTLLDAHGYLRPRDLPTTATRGDRPPSPIYDVHLATHDLDPDGRP